jgi:endonuclease V-like protein UPF0215 family
MNKKEKAKSEKLLRKLGFSEKQIKTIIKKAGKNTTAEDLAILIWAWDLSVAFAIAEIFSLRTEIPMLNKLSKEISKLRKAIK